MSEADAPTTREDQMLARLAALDLALAEKVHAMAMAAEDASAMSELGRTYQRLSHSLRQTLALKAQLRRRRTADARELVTAAGRPHTS